MNASCYCGKLISFVDCCEAIHLGRRKAETAEELMRSRYSAFVSANIDYILKTYSSKTRPVNQGKEILEWAKSVKWLKLEVVNSQKGSKHDQEGFVEFKAYYIESGREECLHENSYFEREDGNWVYVSGEYPKKDAKPKLPNRNEPCFCGSGKKFKKCCYSKI